MTATQARSLGLARGLQVELATADEGLLAWSAPLAEPGRAPAARLVVVADTAQPAPTQRDRRLSFETTTRWAGARGSVLVDGGSATIELDPLVRAELRAHPDALVGATNTLLRLLLALLLPTRGGVLLHASAVALDGRAWLLVGASGAGKTTTARRAGREGAMRLADDLAVAWTTSGGAAVEPCVFDQACRLPGRRGLVVPLVGMHPVHKGAAATQPGRWLPSLSTWASALLLPPVPAGLGEPTVATLAALAAAVRPRALEVAPAGPVLDVLRSTAISRVP